VRFVAKALLVVAALALAALYFLTTPSRLRAGSLQPRSADLANGATLFHAGGCASCHATPGQDDKQRLGGGLALATAFGTFKVPNISPDRRSGLGGWTEEQFVDAMRSGTGREGEHLYPAFPYTSYQRMPVDDVRDLFAFLATLPPETRASEPHALRFPFNVRLGLGLWKLLYLDGKTFAGDPAKSAELNRGAYLVEGPGHCAECHSPRDMFGGIVAAKRFAGGIDAEGKEWVPNITQHADGISGWSEEEIALMLENGLTPSFGGVASTMADVVANTGKLSPQDRAAMAGYIKSLPPRAGRAPKE